MRFIMIALAAVLCSCAPNAYRDNFVKEAKSPCTAKHGTTPAMITPMYGTLDSMAKEGFVILGRSEFVGIYSGAAEAREFGSDIKATACILERPEYVTTHSGRYNYQTRDEPTKITTSSVAGASYRGVAAVAASSTTVEIPGQVRNHTAYYSYDYYKHSAIYMAKASECPVDRKASRRPDGESSLGNGKAAALIGAAALLFLLM